MTVTGTTRRRQHDRRPGHQHRPQLVDDLGDHDRAGRRLLLRRRPGHRRDDRADIVATAADGATAHASPDRRVRLRARHRAARRDRPDNDDNGPGNYAYPTSDNFHAGAFDIQRFQVFDDGTNIIFRVQTRDLRPTFGSPLGAQLVDVYVHDPAAPAIHLDRGIVPAAQLPDRAGLGLEPPDRGPGLRAAVLDASGATLGTVSHRRTRSRGSSPSACPRRRSARRPRAGRSPSS